jgi:preprotein translocase subunit YajC
MFISDAYAQTAEAAGGGDMLVSLAPLVLIFIVFWFFLIRPQQKRMKEHKALVAALKKGDKVLTNGGILGTVTKIIDDHEAEVEIAAGVRVRFLRSAVSEIVNKTGSGPTAKPEKAEAPKAVESKVVETKTGANEA